MEHYREGYPRLAAFLNLDKDFSVLRRFDYLHMRCLLDQQDQLVELEDQLHRFDDEEQIELRLRSRRQDEHQERRDLLNLIRTKVESYGKYSGTQRGSSLLWLGYAKQRSNNQTRQYKTITICCSCLKPRKDSFRA